MTVSSRSSRRSRVDLIAASTSAWLGVLVLALPIAAAAQVGAPVQLLPEAPPDYGAVAPAPPESESGAAGPSAPQGFEVDTLGAIDADFAGTLEPDGGGLGPDMWRGTDRAKVERLLPLLKPATSPILAELTQRLLLSNAVAPPGRGSGRNVLPVRAGLLGEMGLVDEARALLRLLPADQLDAESARLLTELSWRAGDPDGACAVVEESVPRLPIDGFWQRASIFCQLRAGRASEAALGLDLLREQGESDEIFFALAEALGGGDRAELPPLPVVTPLYLAMARATGLPVPDIAIHEPPPLVLALIAESPDVAIEWRLTAAEAAAAAGVLPPRRLAAAYTAEPEDPGVLDTAIDLPDIGATPAARAILYQAAVRVGVPQQRARLVEKALDADVLDPNYWTRVRLYLPLLADIAAAPELTWFADAAARHLFAGGKLREAGDWVALLERDPNAEAAADAPRLAALEYLAGENDPVPSVDALVPATDASAERLRVVFGVLEEPVVPPSAELQSSSLAVAPAPSLPRHNVNLWLDLGEAAARQRLGETVLLTLVGLNAMGLAEADPQWLARGIASLHGVGLAEEARRLAIEAALVNGL